MGMGESRKKRVYVGESRKERPFNMENRPSWALLARYVAEGCNSREQRRVEAWLRADPSRRQLIEELRSIWGAAEEPPRRPQSEFDTESGWQDAEVAIGSATFAKGEVLEECSCTWCVRRPGWIVVSTIGLAGWVVGGRVFPDGRNQTR